MWYVPRYDRLGGTLISSSLLSAATFKERETERRKRQKQTGLNTGQQPLLPALFAFLYEQKQKQKTLEQKDRSWLLCFRKFTSGTIPPQPTLLLYKCLEQEEETLAEKIKVTIFSLNL